MQDGLRYVDAEQVVTDLGGFPPNVREVLDTINRRVAAAESLDRVMEFLWEATRPLCPCDRIGLAFLEDGGARVSSRWVRADYEPVLLGAGYGEETAGSSLEELVRGRRLRIIDDLSAYLEAHPDSRSTRILVREGVRSSMTCPLLVDGRPVGLLFRSSRRPRAYGEAEVVMHLAVAERLSQAVEKAWRIEQLAAANAAYSEMLGFVAHELKSPVGAMILEARMILDGYAGPVAEEQRRRLDRLVAKGEYLLGLVRDYLDLARVEAGDLAPAIRDGVDLAGEVLEMAIEIAAPQAAEKGITIERDWPETPFPVAVDPDLLRIVAVNLVGNGVKYGREGGRVRVSARRTPEGFRAAVFNEGPGFPESQRSRLFRKFSRVQDPELMRRKGTGVGLYTVARIVRMHGGRVGAESEPGSWAEFRFEIPQPPVLPQEARRSPG
ncbi:GAF domain-containing sensor histidine kinase [Myxococcota bacterium]|nr:GAF domain-containing sensor histidine kinase [Myxococcota bacterium]